jgi:hypothetical protein
MYSSHNSTSESKIIKIAKAIQYALFTDLPTLIWAYFVSFFRLRLSAFVRFCAYTVGAVRIGVPHRECARLRDRIFGVNLESGL